MQTIHFWNSINNETSRMLRNMVINSINKGEKEIKILFSSDGGDLNAGMNLYNYFRNIQSDVTVKICNVGSIESIAVIVYLAFDKRLAIENSRFLLHSFHWNTPQYTDHMRLTEYTESLNYHVERYAQLFNERTQFAKNQINILDCLNGHSLIIPATTATSCGIVSEIISDELAFATTCEPFFD